LLVIGVVHNSMFLGTVVVIYDGDWFTVFQ
jgi:hypothetical protein